MEPETFVALSIKTAGKIFSPFLGSGNGGVAGRPLRPPQAFSAGRLRAALGLLETLDYEADGVIDERQFQVYDEAELIF